MRRDLPSGTVTFLFTDIEGSTRLLHELGAEAYSRSLAEHRRIVRDACTARDGVEVDTQGDGFFLAFPTAHGALGAAAAITERLASTPITVRMGLHTGRPLVTDEGYVGDDVHLAARVAASAHGGQVVLSQATRSLLDDRYTLLELGEHRLKDIGEPIAIFQHGDARFPPLKTIWNTNLPRPASSFVGREYEVSELLARIEGGARLVTLTGPGGSGKTRLSLEAAATLIPSFKAGVFWIGLATLREAALVGETIARTVGARGDLADHIGERELLLVLDNFEQVIDAAPELSSLLEGCPNLKLLVTSRELLRLRGEVEYPVPPLAEAEAVALFCERAQIAPTAEIAELCRRLDLLPLAVELAAARAKALSPAQILARLSRRLDLFKGSRDADPRQQTLRATIDWSYDLLSPEERQLVRHLSIFSGGCILSAAEDVAGGDVDTLQALVEKSLLRLTGDRFWMLETIREFALEHARALHEDRPVAAVHAAWFADLVQETESELQQGSPSAMQTIDDELDNVRASLQWTLDSGARDLMSRLLTGTRFFWLYAARVREGAAWARRALPIVPELPPEERASLLNAISKLVRFEGDFTLAKELTSEQVLLLRQLDNRAALAGALDDLVWIAIEDHDLEAASAFNDEELALRRKLGDQTGIADALSSKAGIAFSAGRFGDARELYGVALDAYEADEKLRVALTILMLGQCSRRLAELPIAARQLRRAFELVLEVVDVMLSIECVQEIGALALANGDRETAARLLGASERLRAEHSVRLWDPSDWEQSARQLRGGPAAATLEAAWQAGARLERDEAIAAALEYMSAAFPASEVSAGNAFD